MPPCPQLAQRRRAAARPGRAASAARRWATRGSWWRRWAARTGRLVAVDGAPPRCGCGCCSATGRVAARRAAGRPQTARGRRRCATSPPRSSDCLRRRGALLPRDGSARADRCCPATSPSSSHQRAGRRGPARRCAPPASRSCVTGRTASSPPPAAQEWQLLLEALEQPHRTARVARARARARSSAGAAEAGRGRRRRRLTGSRCACACGRGVFEERGVAALFERCQPDRRLPPRLLAARRRAAAHRPAARRRGAARGGAAAPARAHRAGRLAAPPPRGGGARAVDPRAQPPARLRRRSGAGHHRAHQQGAGVPGRAGAVRLGPLATPRPGHRRLPRRAGRRCATSAGPAGRTGSATWPSSRAEEPDEDLRLTYVALTRAQAHLVAWWAPTQNTRRAALHRLLLHDDPLGGRAAASIAVPRRRPRRCTAIRAAGGSADGLPSRWSSARPVPVLSACHRPGRAPALSARRASTGRSTPPGGGPPTARSPRRRTTQPRVGSEPESDAEGRRADLDAGRRGRPPAPTHALRRGAVSAWDALPGGAASAPSCTPCSRTWPTRPTRVRPRTARGGARPLRMTSGLDVGALADAIALAAVTPLGPLADGRPLADLARRRPADRAGLRAAAGRRRPARSGEPGWPTWSRCGASTAGPARSPATPTRWPSWSRRRCAATSPAASTPCCGSDGSAVATSSSTTRPTGSAVTTSR